MTLEAFREAVKKDGWLIILKGGYIYFKRRDLSKPENQGYTYSCHTKDPEEAMKRIQDWILHGFPLTRENSIFDNIKDLDKYIKPISAASLF